MKRCFQSLLCVFGVFFLFGLVPSAGLVEKSFPDDESGYLAGIQPGVKTTRSTIDSSCFQRLGIFTVPADMVALNFKIRQLHQGVSCTTALPIHEKSFAIKNRANDEPLYRFRQKEGENPTEGLGKLELLVLPPGEYALSVAGGNGAICSLSYDLVSPSPQSLLPAGPSSLRSYITHECVQNCVELNVGDYSIARGFNLTKLESGYNCQTGDRIDALGFSILNIDTDEVVYRLVRHTGQDPIERYGPLDRLILKPGHYRMCVLGGKGAECILSYEWGAGSDTIPPPQEKRDRRPRPDEQETEAGEQQAQPESGKAPGQAVKEAEDEQKAVEKEFDEFLKEAEKAGQALEFTEKWDKLMEKLQVLEEQIHILNENAKVTTNKETLEILKQEMARNVGLYKETKDQLVALSSDDLFKDEISPYELKELVDQMHQVKSDLIGFSNNVSNLKNRLTQDDLERYGTPFKDFDRFIKTAMDEIEGKENRLKSLEIGSGTVGISRTKKWDFGKMDREILSEMVKLQKQIDELDRSIGKYPDPSSEEEAVVNRISSLYPKYLDRFIKQHNGSRCKFKILKCAERRADGCWHFEWEGECPADPNAFNWYPIGSKGKYCSLADLKAMLKQMEDSLR